MTNGAPHDKDLLEEQSVVIDTSEIMGNRNKEHVIAAATGLQSLKFGFRYIRDPQGNVNRVWGVFVTTVEDIKGTNLIRLTINRDIFPVLTYYGESVGGTLLLKGPELETKGRHAKIIREMLISRKGIGYMSVDLGELKMMLGLSPEYRPACLRKDILEPVRRYLLESSDIWFEYEMMKSREPGRKASISSVFFWIYTGKEQGGYSFPDYSTVHRWAVMLTGDPVSHENIRITDTVCESGRLHHLAEKCRFYGDMVRTTGMERDHALNIIRKILKDDFQVTV